MSCGILCSLVVVATVVVGALMLFLCSTSPQISKTSLLLVVQHPPSVCRLRPHYHDEECLCVPDQWTIDHLWPYRFAPPWPCKCTADHCPEVDIEIQAKDSRNVCNLWPDIICNQCCRNWIYNEWNHVANCLFSDPIFSQDPESVAHHYFELAEGLFLQANITERLKENSITAGSMYTMEQFQDALKPEVIMGCQTVPNQYPQVHYVTRIGICFDCDSLTSNSCKQIACRKEEPEPLPWSSDAEAPFLNETERDIHCPQQAIYLPIAGGGGGSPCNYDCLQGDSVTYPNTGSSLCDYV